MFNGIIFNTGIVRSIKKNLDSIVISLETNLKLTKKDLGSSISCDGVCLTVAKINNKIVEFYISKETLKRSNLKSIKKNKTVNLEKSISYGQTISGNFTQGHVDTVAKINKITFIDKTWVVRFKMNDSEFNKFIVDKASISINGVSLTISKVTNDYFEIYVIPHTLKLTNLKNLKINDVVNVELDIFGKYIYKYCN